MPKKVKKGVDILVSIGANVLGGQRNATLNRSAEAIDTTSKESEGWNEREVGFKEWSVDCDGLMIETDVAYGALETAFMEDQKIDVDIAFKSGAKYSGKAVITDFPIEAPYDDAATYSLTLEGDGKLTKTEAPVT